jgi:hypothetical protein
MVFDDINISTSIDVEKTAIKLTVVHATKKRIMQQYCIQPIERQSCHSINEDCFHVMTRDKLQKKTQQ